MSTLNPAAAGCYSQQAQYYNTPPPNPTYIEHEDDFDVPGERGGRVATNLKPIA